MVITASLREPLHRDGRPEPSPDDARLLRRSMLLPCTTVHNGREPSPAWTRPCEAA